MDKVIDFIFSKDAMIAILSAVLSTIATAYFFFKDHNADLSRERLEKVYFPIYKELEGYFFKFSSDNALFLTAITNVESIIDKNRLIAGNKLYSTFEIFWKNKNRSNFKKLCNLVLNEHNRLLRKTGLPTISPMYRVNHGMFDTLSTILFFIKYSLMYAAAFMALFIAFLLLISITFALLGLSLPVQ